MPNTSPQIDANAVSVVLRQARRYQRAAQSDSISSALPVLRRLIAAGAIAEQALTTLFQSRSSLQRKHFLRMLALEAGFSSWESYRPALAKMSAGELDQFYLLEEGAAYLNVWFADLTTAQQYSTAQGGRVIKLGAQALVLAS